MTQERLPSKFTFILHADIAGSTALVQQDEELAHKRIQDTFRRFGGLIANYHGHLCELRGDALLAEFERASDAVSAALAFQASQSDYLAQLDDNILPTARVGIAMGEVIVADNTVTGAGVVLAQRMEQLASPGGVVVQSSVAETVPMRLPFDFDNLGEQSVKGFDQPVRVCVARLKSGAPIPGPESNVKASQDGLDDVHEVHDKPSIAVLPFTNMSGDAEQEYLADGITEDILTGLSHARWLVVASRNSSFAYKDKSTDAKRIAKELGVRYILEGSVRIAGLRTRITAQLIDATADRHIWAERYDRGVEDIFDLQDEITETILGTIEPELGAAEQERARRKPPDSLDAWDLYLRGQWHLYRFRTEDNKEAQDFFRQAIELDPNFAASYTGLAYACYLAVMQAFTDNPDKMIQTGIEAARHAVSLDDKDAMSFSVLSRILTMGREHDAAIAAGRMGIDLNPNIAQVRFGYASALVLADRLEEGLIELDKVIRLSPRDPNAWSFMIVRSWALCALGRFEEAVEAARHASEQPRSVLWPKAVLASALGHLGRNDEAKQALTQFRQENPEIDAELLWQRLAFKNPAHVQTLVEGIRKIQHQE